MSKRISVTPVTQTGAYTAAKSIGGIITFPAALTENGGRGTLLDADLLCKINGYAGAFDLYLFSALPTGTYTDQTTFNLNAADLTALHTVLHLTDVTQSGTGAVVFQQATSRYPIPMVNSDTSLSENLYGILVVRTATLTGASVADIIVRIKMANDIS